jgi:CRP-like cAMP-binding protein
VHIIAMANMSKVTLSNNVYVRLFTKNNNGLDIRIFYTLSSACFEYLNVFRRGNTMLNREDEVIDLLHAIRDLLEPISENHRQQYLRDRELMLQGVITPVSRKIIPLLFDPRQLTQQRIAEIAGVSQPTVSRVIRDLKARNLIAEVKDENYNVKFVDKWDLLTFLESNDEKRS